MAQTSPLVVPLAEMNMVAPGHKKVSVDCNGFVAIWALEIEKAFR